MRRVLKCSLLTMFGVWAFAGQGVSPTHAIAGLAQTGAHHAAVTPDRVPWKRLSATAEMAIVSGDPDKAGSEFVVRFRYSAKARIAPHWHPVDEHLTILAGTFRLGTGTSGDEATTTALEAGSYAHVAMKMVHYAWADAGTLVQVHGIGPFVINYVNPDGSPVTRDKQ